MDEKDIDISLNKDSITIKGEKKEEAEHKGKESYVVERSYGSFTRVLPLPKEVNPDKAEATFKKGVLTVTLPKVEKEKESQKRIGSRPTERPDPVDRAAMASAGLCNAMALPFGWTGSLKFVIPRPQGICKVLTRHGTRFPLSDNVESTIEILYPSSCTTPLNDDGRAGFHRQHPGGKRARPDIASTNQG
jgi:hypothetical protein